MWASSRPHPGLCLPRTVVENSPAGPAIGDLLCIQTRASWTLNAHSTCRWILFFSPRIIMVCCCSGAQSCPTLCEVEHNPPPRPATTAACQASLSFTISQLAQTHVHWVGDAIQLSHPLSPSSLPALNLPQHQGLFQWVGSSNQVA